MGRDAPRPWGVWSAKSPWGVGRFASVLGQGRVTVLEDVEGDDSTRCTATDSLSSSSNRSTPCCCWSLLELSSSVRAQGTRRGRLHLWGACDPGCAATREKPSRAQLCVSSVPVTAMHLPPGSTAFSSEAVQVANEGVGNEMGNERGPGQTCRERISRAACRAAGAGGAQEARVGSGGAVTSSRAGGPKAREAAQRRSKVRLPYGAARVLVPR